MKILYSREIKYDNDGNLQWYHKPEPTSLTETGPAISKGLATEADGTSHWLVRLPEGVYADGAFNNILPGNHWYILKYDTNGNFLNAIALNFEVTNYFATTLKFFRNPYNGQYFITGRKGSSSQESAIINGQEVTHTMFLASFDSNGEFLWKTENTSDVVGSFQLYNLEFDSDNSIYLAGRFLGFGMDSFLGFTISEPIITGVVMKVNSDFNQIIWSTYHNRSASNGAIVLNENEVGFTGWCLGTDFTWGDQTMNVTGPDQGTDVLLARFNKDTGACLGLNRIDSAVGSYDCGTAITADASGDYIDGGGFQSNISINGQTMYNLDSQSDFFVAKYALEPCSELANTDHLMDQIRVYPNPEKDNFIVESVDSLRYEIFNFTGALVAKGTTQKQTNINVSDFAGGVYLLRLYSDDGFVKTVKLLKE